MVSWCRRAAAIVAVVAIASSASANVVDDPNAAADGIYTECLMGMSWSCLQRKALLFINRMAKSERFPLVGDGVISLVRTGPQEPELSEESLRGLNTDSLGELVDNSIYDFFQSHVFRFELPSWLRGSSVEQERSDNAVDFYMGETLEEGRKKGGLGGGGGGGGGGKKGMKKMMMMMCMMAAGKMMMLGPLILGLTKLMAVKALIMGFISLTISKIMILKKLKSKQGGGGGWSSGGSSSGWSSGGGGGGGGWSSGGGGGGWDRSFAHDLAYKGQIIEDNNA